MPLEAPAGMIASCLSIPWVSSSFDCRIHRDVIPQGFDHKFSKREVLLQRSNLALSQQVPRKISDI